MFYTMYLSSVCQRRKWSEPHYEPYTEGRNSGIFCKVRVNNRVYCTDVGYSNEALARDGAAQKAYMICRNFSANDGYHPGERPGRGSIRQGLPAAIGTGRGSTSSSNSSKRNSDSSYDSVSTDSCGSEGHSPKSDGSGFAAAYMTTPQLPNRTSRRHGPKMPVDEYMCYCQRGTVQAYGRCGWCLREAMR